MVGAAAIVSRRLVSILLTAGQLRRLVEQQLVKEQLKGGQLEEE